MQSTFDVREPIMPRLYALMFQVPDIVAHDDEDVRPMPLRGRWRDQHGSER
jgi:hypothetical protein